MAVYAIWNNKGGVGKSYLTFQVAAEYARTHPDRKILVIDLCPQANASGMLLGGIVAGESALEQLATRVPRRTISGYVEDRIFSPYQNPRTGANFVTKVAELNPQIPSNLYLVVGDEQLEIQSSRVSNATFPGPADAWRLVHTWISDLIHDIQTAWNQPEMTVFIDCNPSFSIYTELALSASDRLMIPFSADGSSKRAVRAVLALVYGVGRYSGAQQSEFVINSNRFNLQVPKIYCYIGNRLTQYVGSAAAFKTVVKEIGDEIWDVWQNHPNFFWIRPKSLKNGRKTFENDFKFEINDANTASVVSSALGIPIMVLTAGPKQITVDRQVQVNQSQLDRQQPNISELVGRID
ncbi:MAG: AAA family ATPase [Bacteroidetes bacterium]|nr:AAA family ATPase [Bacteroidota bacterium]